MTDIKPTTITPRNDFILVLPDGGEKMKGRIHVPASAVKVPQRGTVIAVGPGYIIADGSRAKPDLEVGDRVEFRFGLELHPLDIDGVAHYLLKEVDIVAVVTDEPLPEYTEVPDAPSGAGEGAEEANSDAADSEPQRPVATGRIMLAR